MQVVTVMPDQATIARVDAAITFTGLLVRVLGYALVSGVASHYACGQAILTGLFLGDVAATVLRVATHPRELWLQASTELLVLGLVYLWARADLVWPADQPSRALIGLAALGVFAGRAGGNVLTRFGPSDDGFA